MFFCVFFCFCKDAKRIFYTRIRADTGVCPYTHAATLNRAQRIEP